MKTIKDEIAVFTAELSANKRVDLYDKNYLFRIKWTFPVLLLTTLIALSVLFSTGIMNQSQLIVSSILATVMLFVVQLVARRARIATIKGDSIILKGIDSKSTVTSIKSVKKADSYYVFGVQITCVKYILDEQKKSSLVFGAPSGINTSLDQLIRHAKTCKKIKGKS